MRLYDIALKFLPSQDKWITMLSFFIFACYLGSEDDNAKLCAGDVCKESDVPAASIIESEDKEECNGVFKGPF